MKKDKNIQVAIRMRPLLHRYQDHEVWIANSKSKTISSIPLKMLGNTTTNTSNMSNQESSISMKKRTSKVIQKNNVYEFTYDHVFSEQEKNKEVYEQSCQKIVEQFVKGKNASIFMYGQTTSGKTYTMLGGNKEEGLIIYSLKDIFKKLSNEDDKKIKMYISYMEIYNEQINDLLQPQGVNLKIADDTVQNLSQFQISSVKEAIELLKQGQNLRAYAQRTFHDHSSRSHTIFQIKLIQKVEETGKVVSKNVLNLVDLAGSQRVGEDDSNQQTGFINKSLFVLSNVIHKLSQKKSGHIPFRDSKLTRVLSSSLTTSSHTIFICTISPAQINFNQTLSTLRFANQSRKIELKSVDDTVILNQSSFIIQQKQINKLKEENICLRKNLSQKQKHKTTKKSQTFLDRTVKQFSYLIEQQNKQNTLDNGYRRRSHSKQTKGLLQTETSQKIQNLYCEYKRNVEILEKEYIKAMLNLVSSELNLSREEISKKIQSFDDQILFSQFQ